jgi:hypothetical protein
MTNEVQRNEVWMHHNLGMSPDQIAPRVQLKLEEVEQIIAEWSTLVEIRRLLVASAIDPTAKSKIDAQLLKKYTEQIVNGDNPHEFDMALRQLLILK